MKRSHTVHNSVRDQALVEGGKLSTVRAGQCQEIAVRYLRRIQKMPAPYCTSVKQGDVVGPEIVAGQGTQFCQ
jgi:hypothetical protein